MGTDPYARKEHAGDPPTGLDLFKQVIRAAGGMVGVIAMVTGLVYAAKILKLLYDALSAPEGGQPILALAELLGGAELVVPCEAGNVPLAVPLAVVLLVAALLVMGWLALGLITTGAKVIAFCLTEREAMKDLLVYALGQKQKSEEKNTEPDKIAKNRVD
jgi:uncharacterized membrane protein